MRSNAATTRFQRASAQPGKRSASCKGRKTVKWYVKLLIAIAVLFVLAQLVGRPLQQYTHRSLVNDAACRAFPTAQGC
jgi:hypothetical protein